MMKRDLNVLIVGSAGREHTLYEAAMKSQRARKVLVSPGNGGIPSTSRREVRADDVAGIVALAHKENINFVIVGPELPLSLGLVDALQAAGIRAFGPTQKAAELEWSKIFSKWICDVLKIRTARWHVALNMDQAKFSIDYFKGPVVVKADGLCAGKGVFVVDTAIDALNAAYDCLVSKIFGDAGKRIIIEERLLGDEASVMAICDGKHHLLLPTARDYKRALDGDDGENTGGMGAYSPATLLTKRDLQFVSTRIIQPVLDMMRKRGIPFQGLLYAGVMKTQNGIYLLEFNARWGDPEAQVVLPRIADDILDLMWRASKKDGLREVKSISAIPQMTVCKVLVSKGYPNAHETGHPIHGIETAREHALVFHAGTRMEGNNLVSTEGRIMNVVGIGTTFAEARAKAEKADACVQYKNKFSRSDIAHDIE